MRSLRLIAVLPWIAAMGCYSDGPAQSTFPGPGTEPAADNDPRYITGPGSTGTSHAAGGPGPGYVAGPPGGAMDADPAYGAPGPGDSDDSNDGEGDSDGTDNVAEGLVAPAAPAPYGSDAGPVIGGDVGGAVAVGDPGDPGAVAAVDPATANPTANVSDSEIDAALSGSGQWIQTDDYGLVWRPDVTEVGQDFTPYESGGGWQDTDAGWSFVSDYSWGWLPFHYGRWAWFHDYWGWVPGHRWGPAWVEWRHGGGVTGWRPLGPGASSSHHTREFHHRGGGTVVVEHRHPEHHEAHWRFANNRDLGQPHIRGHLSNDLAANLRVTQRVNAPPVHARVTVRTNDVMHHRFDRPLRPNFGRPGREQRQMANPAMRPAYPSIGRTYQPGQPSRAYQPAQPGQPGRAYPTVRPGQPGRAYPTNRPTFSNGAGGPVRGSAPVWSSPRPAPTWNGGGGVARPAPTWNGGGGGVARPAPTWNGGGGGVARPAPTWNGGGAPRPMSGGVGGVGGSGMSGGHAPSGGGSFGGGRAGGGATGGSTTTSTSTRVGGHR